MSKMLRSKKLVHKNRVTVSRMRMQGLTRTEIWERINKENEGLADPISLNAIDQDIMACKRLWARAIPWTQMEMRSQMVAEIERVKRNAWKSYEASCQKSNRQVAMLDSVSKEPLGPIQLTQEIRYGDERHLRVVLECLDMEARVFGLYTKEPIEFVGQKQINVAFIVDTKGKSLSEVANFPIKGDIHPPELKPPKDGFDGTNGDQDASYSGNGEEP
jgi:hypothetical protein